MYLYHQPPSQSCFQTNSCVCEVWFVLKWCHVSPYLPRLPFFPGFSWISRPSPSDLPFFVVSPAWETSTISITYSQTLLWIIITHGSKSFVRLSDISQSLPGRLRNTISTHNPHTTYNFTLKKYISDFAASNLILFKKKFVCWTMWGMQSKIILSSSGPQCSPIICHHPPAHAPITPSSAPYNIPSNDLSCHPAICLFYLPFSPPLLARLLMSLRTGLLVVIACL